MVPLIIAISGVYANVDHFCTGPSGPIMQAQVNTYLYLYSFLPRTIPHWNDLCIPNLSTIDPETFKQSTTPTL